MPQPAFDSVCELAAEQGLIGCILRRQPEWLLREADRWPDPWTFLLSVRDLPKDLRQVFKAALSQRNALNRLAEIARRAGSIDGSWGRKMVEATHAGSEPAMIHAQAKVFASYWRYDPNLMLEDARKVSPALEAEVRKRSSDLYEKARRKLGRKKADQKNRPAVFEPQTATQKIASQLAWGWLRKPNRVPGYCFFSDNALLNVCRFFLRMPGLQFETILDTRRALGLIKAPILIYTAKPGPDGDWTYLDRGANPVFSRE
jgi:hypothetical protein